ncbi:MAG: hypothetical protein R3C97_10825 [Geminicoccaceae bacterium]
MIERHIKPEELPNAQEIFVTGTAAEVTPVRAIDDLSYQLGPVTQSAMEDFQPPAAKPGSAAATEKRACILSVSSAAPASAGIRSSRRMRVISGE